MASQPLADLLRVVDTDTRHDLEAALQPEVLRAGDVLFRQGDPTGDVFQEARHRFVLYEAGAEAPRARFELLLLQGDDRPRGTSAWLGAREAAGLPRPRTVARREPATVGLP